MDLIGILHDLLHYFAGILFAYGLGWVHGAKSYKHFIERKANVKIIETSTLTIVPKERNP